MQFFSIQKTKSIPHYRYHGNLKNARKLTGFCALYFRYMYMLGVLPKQAPHKRQVHFLLREDLLKIDKITEKVTLLGKKKINNITELETCEYFVKERLNELIKQRRCIYNKIRRCRNTETKEMLQQDVATLSKEIKQLRKEVVLYEGIKERSVSMKSKLQQIDPEEKERDQNERRWRNSRSGR